MQIERENPRKLHSILSQNDSFNINIIKSSANELVFDMINCDASFANALRRIMLSEVASVAFETVSIYMNKSVMQDEVLAHRLGLIPLKLDPEIDNIKDLTFKLHVKVPADAKRGRKVYSRDIKPSNLLIHEDILITLLVPGEEIELELTCAVGIGADHAKFSPVATASYRNLPVIDVLDKKFTQLTKLCPMGVFGLDDLEEVVVENPRRCTFCRECLRYEVENGEEKVSLQRKTDHFVFQIETVGAIPPKEIFLRALRILRKKAQVITECVEELEVGNYNNPTMMFNNNNDDNNSFYSSD